VYTRRIVDAGRWLIIANALAGIVFLYKHVLHTNNTTVALTLLLLVLILAGNWGLRYAVGASIAATVLFNYFFLPPIGTFTIADTQNWVALFAFLGTAIYASHLAARIREESEEANTRRRESEMLYQLGRQLLQPENVTQLFNFIPSGVANAFNSPAVTLYIAEGDRIYLSDSKRISSPRIAWTPDAEPQPERSRQDILHDLREAMQQTVLRSPADGFPTTIPLHIGVRPSGVLLLEGTCLSRESMEALSGLVAMSMQRAEALEDSARSEAAKETERLRTALLDSVTHELRTPLTSIKASISALLSQQSLDADSRHDLLTVIDEESDTLNHLIEQAVEMAQLDAQKVQLEIHPQPVAPLLHNAVDACRATCPTRDFRIAIPANLPLVLADAAWIAKVLANLLGNAVKYSPVDKPIFLSAEAGSANTTAVNAGSTGNPADMIAISIADRGAGIDPLEQGMIFDKFYRGQSYRDPAQRNRVSGTGMGLAICRAIVTAHGGTIGVTSQLGHGSVFTFTLPSARP
jgi:two-component system, OmpR family, sensor histidine kinase KdpD